jgi:hypothetical protein
LAKTITLVKRSRRRGSRVLRVLARDWSFAGLCQACSSAPRTPRACSPSRTCICVQQLEPKLCHMRCRCRYAPQSRCHVYRLPPPFVICSRPGLTMRHRVSCLSPRPLDYPSIHPPHLLSILILLSPSVSFFPLFIDPPSHRCIALPHLNATCLVHSALLPAPH